MTAAGGDGADSLSGGSSADVFSGGGGDDELYGNGGSDRLDGGAGADWLAGGSGTDTVDYSSRTAPVVVDLGSSGSGQEDGFSSVENATGGAARGTRCSAPARRTGWTAAPATTCSTGAEAATP